MKKSRLMLKVEEEYKRPLERLLPELVNEITKKYKSIYGLINNAGVAFDGVLARMHSTEI